MACGLLLGCPTGNGEPAADTSEPAADTGCVPPDGLMPEGVWFSPDAYTIWVDVDATGEALIYLCDTVTTVDVASVVAGHVAWDVTWTAKENSEFGYTGPGSITGEVCGDVASLVMSPMAVSPQDYTLDPDETSGAGCD